MADLIENPAVSPVVVERVLASSQASRDFLINASVAPQDQALGLFQRRIETQRDDHSTWFARTSTQGSSGASVVLRADWGKVAQNFLVAHHIHPAVTNSWVVDNNAITLLARDHEHWAGRFADHGVEPRRLTVGTQRRLIDESIISALHEINKALTPEKGPESEPSPVEFAKFEAASPATRLYAQDILKTIMQKTKLSPTVYISGARLVLDFYGSHKRLALAVGNDGILFLKAVRLKVSSAFAPHGTPHMRRAMSAAVKFLKAI